jgi:hypothetical protein
MGAVSHSSLSDSAKGREGGEGGGEGARANEGVKAGTMISRTEPHLLPAPSRLQLCPALFSHGTIRGGGAEGGERSPCGLPLLVIVYCGVLRTGACPSLGRILRTRAHPDGAAVTAGYADGGKC